MCWGIILMLHQLAYYTALDFICTEIQGQLEVRDWESVISFLVMRTALT